MRLEHSHASAEAALTMLAQLFPAQSGEALHGLLALARHQLACQPAFIAGFSSHLNQLSEAHLINALPDLRAAMAWLATTTRDAGASGASALSTGATSRFGAANAVALSTTGHCTSSTTRTAGTGIAAKLGSFPCLN